MINTYTRNCLECGILIHGRSDKKFCSDQCRSSHRHHLEDDERQLMRRINYILRRNRRILASLRGQGHNATTIDILSVLGFDFDYFTNVRTAPGGTVYFCYDLGFILRSGGKRVELVTLDQPELNEVFTGR